MSKPIISVVLATYNAGKTLQNCLDSLRAQDRSVMELILIDGASTDNTLNIISANEDIISAWESSPDTGIYNAWNKAVKYITGDWVYFIGADDYLSGPTVLSTAASMLGSIFPAHRIAYGQVDLVKNGGHIWMTAGQRWNRADFMQAMSIPHQGVFQHRSLFAEYGLFDESFSIVGDYEFLLRELKDKDAVFLPYLKVAAMGYGGVSSNPSNSLKALKEISRAREKHKLKGFPFRLYWAYLKVILRFCIAFFFGEKFVCWLTNIYRGHLVFKQSHGNS